MTDGPSPESNDSKVRRAWRTARRALPWWVVAVALSVGSIKAAETSWPASGLLLVVLAVALVLFGVAAALGYRRPTPDQRAAVAAAELWHLSGAPVEELTGPEGTVVLDQAKCRPLARMLRSDAVWRPSRRAVYFFRGAPSKNEAWANVGASTRRSAVVVPGHLVAGEIFVRWDGAVALPGGYRGPGEVRSLNRN